MFNNEQKQLLKKIDAPYYEREELTEDELIELQDFITDYVMQNEVAEDTSEFGEKLLALHDLIVEKFDS
jgi:hypothetical protein